MAELFLIIGTDSLADIQKWYRQAEVLARCTLAAVSRPGLETPDLAALEAVLPGASQRVVVVDGPKLDISATDLRTRWPPAYRFAIRSRRRSNGTSGSRDCTYSTGCSR